MAPRQITADCESVPLQARLHSERKGVASEEIVKGCACGARYSLTAWQKLALCGVMTLEEEVAEIRHCPCGSSLALRERARRSHAPRERED